MADDVLLSIETLISRPRVSIDDHIHEIISPEELSLIDSSRLAALGRELSKLRNMDQLKPVHLNRLPVVLREIEAIVMAPVPQSERDKLTDVQRLEVIEVFTALSLARKARLAGAMMTSSRMAAKVAAGAKETEDRQGIGAKSSPGSNASTAATPSAG